MVLTARVDGLSAKSTASGFARDSGMGASLRKSTPLPVSVSRTSSAPHLRYCIASHVGIANSRSSRSSARRSVLSIGVNERTARCGATKRKASPHASSDLKRFHPKLNTGDPHSLPPG